MKTSGRGILSLMLVWSAAVWLGGNLVAQPVSTVPLPPVPVYRPPTEIFRDLLKLSAADREARFSLQPGPLRERLEAKVQEYEAMTPESREARLHATELHEYLEYYVKTPLTNLDQQMASVPESYRKEVRERLTEFNLLPPGLRDAVLTNETTAGYFIGPRVASARPAPPMPPDPIKPLTALSPGEREQMYASFQHYFELGPDDQRQVIAAIPIAERIQVAKTLAQIGSLPAEEREQSLSVISTLAGMSDLQRQVFFNDLERWKAMPSAERDTWLKVVSHLPAPPMPPSRTPSVPPTPSSRLASPGPPLSASNDSQN